MPHDVSRQDREPAPDLELTVLGAVSMRWCGTDVDLGTPQQRALWAVLVLRSQQVVPVEELVEALWDGEAPTGARTTVRTYVSRLRRVLTACGADGEVRLESRSGGYGLFLPPGVVDVDLFRGEVAAARAAVREGRDSLAHERLRTALARWTGRALAGVDGPYLTARRAHLELLHADAVEDLWAAELETAGPGPGTVAELVDAVAAEPLRERRRELLMLALYRSGRQAEALATYRGAHEFLAAELGVDPGPGLQSLHEKVLRADPALAGRIATRRPDANAPGGAPAGVPAQLPPRAEPFVGRAELLDRLAASLPDAGRLVVEGLTGLGGTGTSALAVQVAHRVRGSFPDGQLYADLRGGAGPVNAHDVLGAFLRALGTAPHAVPEARAERIATWRTVTDGRRLLLLLDHVTTAETVRDLLPAGAGSAVLFTSARRLPALSPVRWTTVGPLPAEESLELLGAVAGHERVLAEREVSEQVVAACSHLPLAVRVAAARLLDRPGWSIAQIAAQLADDLREPVVMAADCAIVDAPLQRVQDSLGHELGQAFCLLAVPDCAWLDGGAAAAVLDVAPVHARGVLEELVDAHLLRAEPGGRYRFPGLVKAFARRQAWVADHDRCRAALQRLVEHHAQALRERTPSAGASLRSLGTARRDLPVPVLQEFLVALPVA
ncbi:BTAD domain-containing putative transcriptional regulator [Kineococcus sp. R86509]|uniref:AfsR/SARP family transcriptional regulator n=1 Tax=Kineococcus sp. R86509 TaxID=3093851 RepID=UPI0036D3ECA8